MPPILFSEVRTTRSEPCRLMIAGGILNVIQDPIFIYTLNMRIKKYN
ncbi:MAG: hypothetical protein WAQ02_10395 [Methanosarcina flavescens]|nr:hypothetical protein [Methanosarcina flavescens]